MGDTNEAAGGATPAGATPAEDPGGHPLDLRYEALLRRGDGVRRRRVVAADLGDVRREVTAAVATLAEQVEHLRRELDRLRAAGAPPPSAPAPRPASSGPAAPAARPAAGPPPSAGTPVLRVPAAGDARPRDGGAPGPAAPPRAPAAPSATPVPATRPAPPPPSPERRVGSLPSPAPWAPPNRHDDAIVRRDTPASGA